MAATTHLGETPVQLNGDLPQVGEKAPGFRVVKEDMSELSLADIDAKATVLTVVPSLDTPVCQAQTRKFNEEIDKREGAFGVVISKDLPFAMKRFCETEGIKTVVSGSDFRYNEVSNNYHVAMAEGPLAGITARATFVIDGEQNIRYVELTHAIGDEPDYDAALKAVDELL